MESQKTWGDPATTDPTDLVLRLVAAADLPARERITAATEHGISSLPNDPAKRYQRIERSMASFASQDAASGEGTCLFVLEDTAAGEVVGTSDITASAGFHDRFHSYRNEFVVHPCQQCLLRQPAHAHLASLSRPDRLHLADLVLHRPGLCR